MNKLTKQSDNTIPPPPKIKKNLKNTKKTTSKHSPPKQPETKQSKTKIKEKAITKQLVGSAVIPGNYLSQIADLFK